MWIIWTVRCNAKLNKNTINKPLYSQRSLVQTEINTQLFPQHKSMLLFLNGIGRLYFLENLKFLFCIGAKSNTSVSKIRIDTRLISIFYKNRNAQFCLYVYLLNIILCFFIVELFSCVSFYSQTCHQKHQKGKAN